MIIAKIQCSLNYIGQQNFQKYIKDIKKIHYKFPVITELFEEYSVSKENILVINNILSNINYSITIINKDIELLKEKISNLPGQNIIFNLNDLEKIINFISKATDYIKQDFQKIIQDNNLELTNNLIDNQSEKIINKLYLDLLLQKKYLILFFSIILKFFLSNTIYLQKNTPKETTQIYVEYLINISKIYDFFFQLKNNLNNQEIYLNILALHDSVDQNMENLKDNLIDHFLYQQKDSFHLNSIIDLEAISSRLQINIIELSNKDPKLDILFQILSSIKNNLNDLSTYYDFNELKEEVMYVYQLLKQKRDIIFQQFSNYSIEQLINIKKEIDMIVESKISNISNKFNQIKNISIEICEQNEKIMKEISLNFQKTNVLKLLNANKISHKKTKKNQKIFLGKTENSINYFQNINNDLLKIQNKINLIIQKDNEIKERNLNQIQNLIIVFKELNDKFKKLSISNLEINSIKVNILNQINLLENKLINLDNSAELLIEQSLNLIEKYNLILNSKNCTQTDELLQICKDKIQQQSLLIKECTHIDFNTINKEFNLLDPSTKDINYYENLINNSGPFLAEIDLIKLNEEIDRMILIYKNLFLKYKEIVDNKQKITNQSIEDINQILKINSKEYLYTKELSTERNNIIESIHGILKFFQQDMIYNHNIDFYIKIKKKIDSLTLDWQIYKKRHDHLLKDKMKYIFYINKKINNINNNLKKIKINLLRLPHLQSLNQQYNDISFQKKKNEFYIYKYLQEKNENLVKIIKNLDQIFNLSQTVLNNSEEEKLLYQLQRKEQIIENNKFIIKKRKLKKKVINLLKELENSDFISKDILFIKEKFITQINYYILLINSMTCIDFIEISDMESKIFTIKDLKMKMKNIDIKICEIEHRIKNIDKQNLKQTNLKGYENILSRYNELLNKQDKEIYNIYKTNELFHQINIIHDDIDNYFKYSQLTDIKKKKSKKNSINKIRKFETKKNNMNTDSLNFKNNDSISTQNTSESNQNTTSTQDQIDTSQNSKLCKYIIPNFNIYQLIIYQINPHLRITTNQFLENIIYNAVIENYFISCGLQKFYLKDKAIFIKSIETIKQCSNLIINNDNNNNQFNFPQVTTSDNLILKLNYTGKIIINNILLNMKKKLNKLNAELLTVINQTESSLQETERLLKEETLKNNHKNFQILNIFGCVSSDNDSEEETLQYNPYNLKEISFFSKDSKVQILNQSKLKLSTLRRNANKLLKYYQYNLDMYFNNIINFDINIIYKKILDIYQESRKDHISLINQAKSLMNDKSDSDKVPKVNNPIQIKNNTELCNFDIYNKYEEKTKNYNNYQKELYLKKKFTNFIIKQQNQINYYEQELISLTNIYDKFLDYQEKGILCLLDHLNNIEINKTTKIKITFRKYLHCKINEYQKSKEQEKIHSIISSYKEILDNKKKDYETISLYSKQEIKINNEIRNLSMFISHYKISKINKKNQIVLDNIINDSKNLCITLKNIKDKIEK